MRKNLPGSSPAASLSCEVIHARRADDSAVCRDAFRIYRISLTPRFLSLDSGRTEGKHPSTAERKGTRHRGDSDAGSGRPQEFPHVILYLSLPLQRLGEGCREVSLQQERWATPKNVLAKGSPISEHQEGDPPCGGTRAGSLVAVGDPEPLNFDQDLPPVEPIAHRPEDRPGPQARDDLRREPCPTRRTRRRRTA